MTECYWTKPIILEERDVDVMSDSTVIQILQHNELYEKYCQED